MATVIVKNLKQFDKFRNSMSLNKKDCLKAIGEYWKSLATKIITERNIVDTGQLRRTVDFNVKGEVLEVGSPMEYAKYVEKQRKGGFLKDSALMLQSNVKPLVISILTKHIE